MSISKSARAAFAAVMASTGLSAAAACGYMAWVAGIVIVAVVVWLIGWAFGLWMRGLNR